MPLALNSWSNTFSKYTFTGRIFGNWDVIHVYSLLAKIYQQIMFAFCTTLYVHIRSNRINDIYKKKTVLIQGIKYKGSIELSASHNVVCLSASLSAFPVLILAQLSWKKLNWGILLTFHPASVSLSVS